MIIATTENIEGRTAERTIGEGISVLVKAAAMAIAVGVLILIGVAIKDRIARAKSEDYKEVEN